MYPLHVVGSSNLIMLLDQPNSIPQWVQRKLIETKQIQKLIHHWSQKGEKVARLDDWSQKRLKFKFKF